MCAVDPISDTSSPTISLISGTLSSFNFFMIKKYGSVRATTQTIMQTRPHNYHPMNSKLSSDSWKIRPFLLSNMPTAMSPQMPQAPCTWDASIGSSTPSFIHNLQAVQYYRLPTSPMKNADQGSQWSQTPVIETKPARTPLHKAPTSYRRVRE